MPTPAEILSMAEILESQARAVDKLSDPESARLDPARHIKDAAAMLRALLAEREDISKTLLAYVAMWAGQYASNNGFPDKHLHPTHYDTLKLYGARMGDFVLHEEPLP